MKKWIPFLIVNILFIITIVVSSIGYGSNYIREFDLKELDVYSGRFNENNDLYLDDTFSNAGIAIAIPAISLQKGSYRLTVEYEAIGSSDHYINIHTFSKYYHALDTNDVLLFEGRNATGSTFYLGTDLDDVTVNIVYSNGGSLLIKGISLERTSASLYKQNTMLAFFFLLLNLIVILKKTKAIERLTTEEKIIGFVFLFTMLLMYASNDVDYFTIQHDQPYHMNRIRGLANMLSSGQFPVRMINVFFDDAGYPSSIFYGDLFLYLPAMLLNLGFYIHEALQGFLLMINALTLFIAYYSFKNLTKSNKLGCVGAVLYTLSAYRIININIRIAVGEFSAMTFFPLVLYGIYRILTEEKESKNFKKSFIPFALGMAGILQTHILSFEIVVFVLAIVCIICIKRVLEKARFLELLKAVVLTILLSLWFLIPFLDYVLNHSIKVFEKADLYIQEYGAPIPQFFYLFYGTSSHSFIASYGLKDEMIHTIGLPLMVGLILFIFLWVIDKQKDQIFQFGKWLACIQIVALLMATMYFPWDWIADLHPLFSKLISSIQFPWRLLTIATIAGVMVTLIVLYYIGKIYGKRNRFIVAMLFIGVTLITYIDVFSFQLQNKDVYRVYTDEGYGIHVEAMGNEYILEEANLEQLYAMNQMPQTENVELVDHYRDKLYHKFTIEKSSGGTVTLPLLAYKGYHAYDVDTREEFVIASSSNALVEIEIPQDYTGTIEVVYEFPWYWRMGDLVSLSSLIVLIVSIVKKRKATH